MNKRNGSLASVNGNKEASSLSGLVLISDWDDSAVDQTYGGLLPFLKAEYGITEHPEGVFTQELRFLLKDQSLDYPTERGIYEHFWASGHFRYAPPKKDAKKIIPRLSNRGLIIPVATARITGLGEITHFQAALYFKGSIKRSQIFHTRNPYHDYKQPEADSLPEKPDVAKKLRAHAAVEDNLAEAKRYAISRIPSYLLNEAWNQGPIPDLVMRVSGWDEIEEDITKRASALRRGLGIKRIF